MNHDQPSPSTSASSTFSIKNVLLASLLPVALVLGVLGYLYLNATPENLGGIDDQIGLADRVKGDRRKLAEGFEDANNDLIADLPTDPAKFVAPEKLVLSWIASPEAIDRKSRLQPLIDHLAKMTGKEVVYEALTDANQQIEFIKEGKIHITAMNTGLVPSAVNLAGFVPYCAPATSEGNFMYEMVLITPTASPIDTPEKLKGRTLAVTTTNSHSGYKMPLVYLRDEKKIVAGKDFDIVLSGGHYETIAGIKKKVYDVGAVASDLLDRAIGEGKVNENEVRVIYRSEPSNPAAPWGYAHNLDPKLTEKIQQGFDTFQWEGTPFAENYKGTKFVKFTKVNYQKDWEPIRKVDAAIFDWKK